MHSFHHCEVLFSSCSQNELNFINMEILTHPSRLNEEYDIPKFYNWEKKVNIDKFSETFPFLADYSLFFKQFNFCTILYEIIETIKYMENGPFLHWMILILFR